MFSFSYSGNIPLSKVDTSKNAIVKSNDEKVEYPASQKMPDHNIHLPTLLPGEPEYIFIIYSCKNNLLKAFQLYQMFLAHCMPPNIKVFILYGDKNVNAPSYRIDHDLFLVLNVEDDYQHLTQKSMTLFETISTVYPRIKGCFKCDDDMLIHFDSFRQILNHITIQQPSYIGVIVSIHKNHFHDKFSKEENQRMQSLYSQIKDIQYCGGPFYYLGQRSLQTFDKTTRNHTILSEDIAIGVHLFQHQIFPTNYPFYKDDLRHIMHNNIHCSKHPKLLYIRVTGGIGNQLFQIAAGFGLAKKNEMKLVILTKDCLNTHCTYNHEFYEMGNLFDQFNTLPVKEIVFTDGYQEKETDCYHYVDIPVKENMYVCGYFQHKQYFHAYREQILNRLICVEKREYQNDLIAKHGVSISDGYFLHIRRGDYVGHPLYKINDKYFQRAIQYIEKREPNALFFVFSDDMPHTEQRKELKGKNYMLMTGCNEVSSLLMMSECKGGICSNSTFSWWGAYMIRNPNKVVVLPKTWFNGQPTPAGLQYENTVLL
jgi:hypothetical protein